MKSRRPYTNLVLRNLDPEDVAYAKSLGWVPPSPYKEDEKFLGPIFQNLSNRIPYVRDPNDIDGTGIHVYAKRKERKYTITGSIIKDDHKVLKPPLSSTYDGVPHVEDVTTIEALGKHPYRVFIDMHSGTVHAVVPSYSKSVLTYWRRYYSLLPRPITEMSSSDILKKCKTTHNLLTHDDEAIAWMIKKDLREFLLSSRHADVTQGKWNVEPKPLTFVGVKNGLPASVDPHYVLAYQFRYGTFKEG